MAELTYTLGEHPQIKELLSVLEQNNLQKQKEEVQALVGYMDSLEAVSYTHLGIWSNPVYCFQWATSS